MAAIDRTAWNALVDDDGSNLVGTPWTKDKVKTVLLDPIDVSIAAAAQVGGNPSFATVSIGASPALTGAVRLSNNSAVTIRDSGNAADLTMVAVDATNTGFVMSGIAKVQLGGGDVLVGLGGLTNAFPAWKRSGTTLSARLADDSDSAPLLARALTLGAVPLGALLPGDLCVNRGGNPGTGYVLFGGSATGHYFGFDGSSFIATDTIRPSGVGDIGTTVTPWRTGYFNSSLVLGTNAAGAGMIRLPNSGYIYGRNNANNADIFLAGVGLGNDTVYLGHPSSPMEIRGSVITCTQGALAIGTNPAQSGPLRLAYNSYITSRDSTNTVDRRLIGFAQNVDLDADASGVSFHGGRSLMICPADGNFEFHNRAGTLWASMAVGTITINNTVSITAAAGLLSIGGDVASTGANGFRAPLAGGFYWPGRSFIASPADGVITLTNTAGSDFGRMQFGGTTAAFPSLRRAGATLQARLADDTNFAGFTAADITSTGPNGIFIATAAWLLWTNSTILNAPANGKLNLTNYAGTIGVGFDFTFDGALKIRNRAQTADAQLFAATFQAQVISLPYAGNPVAVNGEVRLSNNGYGVVFRNAANAADISGIWCSGANEIVVGAATASAVLVDAPVIRLRGPVSVGGSPYATTGTLRLPNGGNIYARNAANTADYRLLELTNGNIGRLGDPTLSIVCYGQLLMDTTALLSIQGPTMFYEMAAAPGAPGAGAVTVFARNTGGKTELIAYFNGGGVVRLAIQP